ncbi:MAG: hypothetical protein ACKON7_11430, partial [Planctomycetaceae bacterium]
MAGAAAAAAALGRLPRGAAAAGGASRTAWPAAGVVIGWLAGGADPLAVGPSGAVLAGCVATAVTVVWTARAGLAPSETTACG